jgi:hypothetical protein
MELFIVLVILLFFILLLIQLRINRKLLSAYEKEKKQLNENLNNARKKNTKQAEKIILVSKIDKKLKNTRIILDEKMVHLQKELIDKLNQNNLLD